MSNANIAFVQSLYAAFGRGDIATIIAAMAPDIAWHSHGEAEDYPTLGLHKGPLGVQKFFQTVAANQTALDFSPREFDAAGDKVFVQGYYAWKLTKNGKTATSDWVHIFTVRNGKVTKFDEFADTAQFARALKD